MLQRESTRDRSKHSFHLSVRSCHHDGPQACPSVCLTGPRQWSMSSAPQKVTDWLVVRGREARLLALLFQQRRGGTTHQSKPVMDWCRQYRFTVRKKSSPKEVSR